MILFRRFFVFSLVLPGAIFFCSCGRGTPTDNSENKPPDQGNKKPESSEYADLSKDDVPEKYALGKKIYEEKCVVCHQADGSGMLGAFPPLKNSDYLLEDPVRGIEQTLNGSFEKMVVNGVSYNAPMTPQVDTKEEALAVINYVLKYFNDSDIELTMEDIRDIEIQPRGE